MTPFETVAANALARLGPARLRILADRLADGWPPEAVLAALPGPESTHAINALLEAHQTANLAKEVAYLRGLAAGYETRTIETDVSLVWSGPATHGVPVRSTAQVLVEIVHETQYELVLMTYSAKPFPPLLAALQAARTRGVNVYVIVETLQGAGSALSGNEPAAAFTDVPGVQLWQWPRAQRTEPGSKMHAKLAVADARALLVSSANLTQTGVTASIEAGILIRGGDVPRRAAEHVRALQETGVLTLLTYT